MTQHRSWKDTQTSIEESVKLQQELEKRINEYCMIAQSIMHKQGVKVTSGPRSSGPHCIQFGPDSFKTDSLPWFFFPYSVKIKNVDSSFAHGNVYEHQVYVSMLELKLPVRDFASYVRDRIQQEKATLCTREINVLVRQLKGQEKLLEKLSYMENIRSGIASRHRMYLAGNVNEEYRENRKFIEAHVPGIEKW